MREQAILLWARLMEVMLMVRDIVITVRSETGRVKCGIVF